MSRLMLILMLVVVLRLLLVFDFGQDFKRDVCLSFVGILELTCEQFWSLHLQILYVGLRWH